MNSEHLPDITSSDNANNPHSLKWVGMENIGIPLKIKINNKEVKDVLAKADVHVNLSKHEAKGIHMSRLHLSLNQLADEILTLESVESLLDNMIESQKGISDNARLILSFDVIMRKDSLVSDEFGYQSYPVKLQAQRVNKTTKLQLHLTIPYSSTCPCSASLSRQLYSDVIDKKFPGKEIDKESLLSWFKSEAGSIATPHSQRSYAYINLEVDDNCWLDISSMISQFEEVIGTAVQAVVKRQDEQEFARKNAQNLMFCEDAARRVKVYLETLSYVRDYWLKVEHQESLHAHNVSAYDQKYPENM